MTSEEDPLYFVVRQYPRGDGGAGVRSAFISRDHPKRIMALDHVIAFHIIDEFSAQESIRQVPTIVLIDEITRRLNDA